MNEAALLNVLPVVPRVHSGLVNRKNPEITIGKQYEMLYLSGEENHDSGEIAR